MAPISNLSDLRDTAWAFRESRVLHIAYKAGIFSLLSEEALSPKDVASTLGLDPDMIERLLIATTAVGLTSHGDGKYENSETAQKYLTPSSKSFQGNWVEHMDSLLEFWWKGIERDLGFKEDKKKDEHQPFILAMHDMAMAGYAQELVELVDLGGKKKLLDMGGGPGTYSIFLCKAYPSLEATVFDLAETLVITREVIAEFGMEDRVQTLQGDWMKDDFGKGNDVVLLSNVLHGEGSEAEMKVAKAFDSMNPGGVLIVRDFVLDDEKTGPLSAAMFNLMLGAYSKKEMKKIIENAGFVNLRIPTLDHESHTILLAEKP